MTDDATHATCLGHSPSGTCIPVGSMTAAALKERQERWVACYKQRVETRRRRLDVRPGVPNVGEVVRAAAVAMRRHLRLPEDAVITVVPPVPFVEVMRAATRDDPTLAVSDEKARDNHG